MTLYDLSLLFSCHPCLFWFFFPDTSTKPGGAWETVTTSKEGRRRANEPLQSVAACVHHISESSVEGLS